VSEIPRAKPPSPVVAEALETKTLPSAKQLEALTPDERRVVSVFAQLADHHRVAAPKPRRTLER
jgi:hypothetical protein